MKMIFGTPTERRYPRKSTPAISVINRWNTCQFLRLYPVPLSKVANIGRFSSRTQNTNGFQLCKGEEGINFACVPTLLSEIEVASGLTWCPSINY